MARLIVSRAMLKLIASDLGMRHTASAATPNLLEFLRRQGLTDNDILAKQSEINAKLKGQGAATSGLSRDEIEELIKAHAGATAGTIANVDMDAVRKIIAEYVAAATPGKIVLAPDTAPVKITSRVHPLYEKVLRLVRAGVNVLLVGPAGCGKSRLAEDVAKGLNRKFGMLPCTSGASESQLTGWLLPIKQGGSFDYVASQFMALFTKGDSLFLLDEIDAADPNMLLVINSVLAGNSVHVAQNYKSPHMVRGKMFSVIAAANTFGTGADVVYAGRNQLDGATLDRFYVIEMTFDEALEAEMMGMDVDVREPWRAADTEDEAAVLADVKELGYWIKGLREKIKAAALKRRTIGTRWFIKAKAARMAGIPVADIKLDLLAGWGRDELTKVGLI